MNIIERLKVWWRVWPWTRTEARIKFLEEANGELLTSWIAEIRDREKAVQEEKERYAQLEHKVEELHEKSILLANDSLIKSQQIRGTDVRIAELEASNDVLAAESEEMEKDLIEAKTEIVKITSRYNAALQGYLKAFVEMKDELIALKDGRRELGGA